MFADPATFDLVLRSLLLPALALAWVIVVVRIIGLRAFSKMTAFDFVITVAIGSLLAGASQATAWSGFSQPSLAIAVLLAVQFALSRLRLRSERVARALQNAPVLLMRDGEILHDTLRATGVARDDLIAKLREANVLRFSEVRAVVLETTGDISVLHGAELQDQLLGGVQIPEDSTATSGAS